MRLKGRGLPGPTAGDQYVVLKIVLPPADTPRAKELYEQMQRDLPFDPRAIWNSDLAGRWRSLVRLCPAGTRPGAGSPGPCAASR